MELLLKKLGIEKVKVVDKNFDEVYDRYKQKAEELGFYGDIKFIKEHSKIMVYVVIK